VFGCYGLLFLFYLLCMQEGIILDNFSINNLKIRSNWFTVDENFNSLFKEIGQEHGLNLYIQMFRFCVLGKKYFFRTSIEELQQYTKINKQKKNKLSYEEIAELLNKLQQKKIVKIHYPNSTNKSLYSKDGSVMYEKLLVIEAIDLPKIERKDNKDYPVTEEDKYININFPLIQYYFDLGLTEFEVVLHLFIKKWSNNPERKMYMKIEKIAEHLGCSPLRIRRSLAIMNKLKLIAIYPKGKGKRVNFEFYILNTLNEKDNFESIHVEAFKRFEKRVENWKSIDIDYTVYEDNYNRLNKKELDDFEEWLNSEDDEDNDQYSWGVPDIMKPFDEEEEYH
jgi:hypothetical protein